MATTFRSIARLSDITSRRAENAREQPRSRRADRSDEGRGPERAPGQRRRREASTQPPPDSPPPPANQTPTPPPPSTETPPSSDPPVSSTPVSGELSLDQLAELYVKQYEQGSGVTLSSDAFKAKKAEVAAFYSGISEGQSRLDAIVFANDKPATSVA